MIAKMIFITALLTGGVSQAAWECTVACKMAVTSEISHIERHASGQDIGDWQAECRAAGGVSNYPGYSNCSYAYCTKHQEYTQMQSGRGQTLTEARQQARAGCYNVPLGGCGEGNTSGWIQEPYNCKEVY